MRFLILSDIHANWHALEAVLADAEGKYDQVTCCGDLVGYNANPDRVVDWVQTNSGLTIRGNHDKVVAGLEALDWFNEVAQEAARWTMRRIDRAHLAYLRELPAGPISNEHFHIWHGSLTDEDEYVTRAQEAAPSFPRFDFHLGFFGHTHLQGGFFSRRGRVGQLAPVHKEETDYTIDLESETLYMINPGSVGQPRDGDPRAAYAIFDTSQRLVNMRRVPYPVQNAAAEIKLAGLPEVLAGRLFQGR